MDSGTAHYVEQTAFLPCSLNIRRIRPYYLPVFRQFHRHRNLAVLPTPDWDMDQNRGGRWEAAHGNDLDKDLFQWVIVAED
jgi:hypothetical protein